MQVDNAKKMPSAINRAAFGLALALLMVPMAAIAQCREMLEQGAVLPWNSFEQGRPLNHGTFEVVEVSGNKLALGQRAANNGTNVTRFDATIDGARFEARNTNPAFPETWRGNCINGMIAGEVDIYTFVINRAPGAQGMSATRAATAQSGLRIEGLLIPDQIKLNERFADGTYAWTFQRIAGTRGYEGQARFSKDGSQYRGRIEFDAVSEDQLIVSRDQHGYYVFPLSDDGRRLRRGGISRASTGHAEIEGMMEAGDDLASDMLLIGPFSFPRSLSMVEAGPGGDYQWQLQRQFNSSLYVGSARNARTGETVQGAVILEGIRDGKLVARRSPSGEYRAEILSDGSGLLPGTISWAPQYRWILPGFTRQTGSASPAVAPLPTAANRTASSSAAGTTSDASFSEEELWTCAFEFGQSASTLLSFGGNEAQARRYWSQQESVKNQLRTRLKARGLAAAVIDQEIQRKLAAMDATDPSDPLWDRSLKLKPRCEATFAPAASASATAATGQVAATAVAPAVVSGSYRGPKAVTYSETLSCIGMIQVLESVEKTKPNPDRAMQARYEAALARSHVLVLERRPAGSSNDSVVSDIRSQNSRLAALLERDAAAIVRSAGEDRDMCLASFDVPVASPAVANPRQQASLPPTASTTVALQEYQATAHCVATLKRLISLESMLPPSSPRNPGYPKGFEMAKAKLGLQARAVGKSPEQMEEDTTRIIASQNMMMDASMSMAVLKFTTEGHKCLRDMGITP